MNESERLKHNMRAIKVACQESKKLGGKWVPCVLKGVEFTTRAVVTREQMS